MKNNNIDGFDYEEDDDQSDVIPFEITSAQWYIGMAIAVGSGILLFVWGWYFSLFDSEFDWRGKPLQDVGFCIWPIFGMFGVGFMFGRTRGGLWVAGVALGIFVLAALAGQVRLALG